MEFGDLIFFATNALLNLQDLTLDAPRLLVLSSSYSYELRSVVLKRMPDLQFFRMTCTQLLQIDFAACANLLEINVANAQIRSLRSIQRCVRLRALNVSDNQLD